MKKSLDVIVSCIEMVYDNEESWNASDCSKKELVEFLDQLNTKQFKQIETFFTTMPKLSHTVTVKNPNTGSNRRLYWRDYLVFSVEYEPY